MLFSFLFLVMTSSQTFADLGSAMTKNVVYKRGHGHGHGHHGHGHGHGGPHNTPPGQCKKNPSAC
jgi:hypothetical protein